MNPRDWPVHDQVDYLLLRSEMDDVYFEQHILREVETNPAYYIEQAINGVAREIPNVVPYSTETAEAIITAFEKTGPIVEQGPKNIIVPDASPDLAAMGTRARFGHSGEVCGWRGAFRTAFSRVTPPRSASRGIGRCPRAGRLW